jgi:hypothetical protein
MLLPTPGVISTNYLQLGHSQQPSHIAMPNTSVLTAMHVGSGTVSQPVFALDPRLQAQPLQGETHYNAANSLPHPRARSSDDNSDSESNIQPVRKRARKSDRHVLASTPYCFTHSFRTAT